jgi:hypothetical protein
MNNYKMGVEGLLNFTNCLFSDNDVVLGTLSVSYKCSQTVIQTSIQFATPASISAGFSERQLHM